MRYKEIKNLRFNPSLLGMGCMRFPLLEDGSIDKAQVKEMFKYALSHGVNYIDTAWPYHGGNSELVVGEMIKDYDRESFYLATKLPTFSYDMLKNAKEIFNKQLEKLGVDYVDFYLVHALNKTRFEQVKELNILPMLEELKKEGKIRHIGFSFHDQYDVFEEIINYYDWEFCQLQINYRDDDKQARIKGIELATAKGLFIIVMEPLKGGALVNLSDEVKEVFRKSKESSDDSLVKWAFRYAASYEAVKVILSGMSSLEQVKDNIKIFEDLKDLSEEDKKIVKEAKAKVLSLTNNNCTSCKYCMPCPAGVNIPSAFSAWNRYKMYGNNKSIRDDYLEEHANDLPSLCVKCGKCEKLCPQHIEIRKDLEKVLLDFGD